MVVKQNRENIKSQKIILLAEFLALGIALNTLENLIIPRGIPIRLGLSNISNILALLTLGIGSCISISIYRPLISSLIAGYFLQPAFYFSLSGGIIAAYLMSLFFYLNQKNIIRMGPIGLSIVGAEANMLGQFVIANIIFGYSVWNIYWIFIWVSLCTGILIGILTLYTISSKRVKGILINIAEFKAETTKQLKNTQIKQRVAPET